jgi:hypothetical protein
MRYKISEKTAHSITGFFQGICFLIMVITVAEIIMLLLGRVQLTIITPDATYNSTLLFEKDHNTITLGLYTHIANITDVSLETNGNIGFLTWLGIVLMGIGTTLPTRVCAFLWFRLFGNISKDKIFVAQNADILQTSGAILILFSIVSPILNRIVFPAMINNLTENRIYFAASFNYDYNATNKLLFGSVLLIMEYVFHYGASTYDTKAK